MKILMCCHLPLDKKLGGAKVYIEAANSYKRLGHEVVLLGIDDLGQKVSHLPLNKRVRTFSLYLCDYLEKHAASFDVVEYEYLYLPMKRQRFSSKTLFVARSVLLEHHLLDFSLPEYRRSVFIDLLKKVKRYLLLKARLRRGNITLRAADLINVPNKLDKDRLILEGFSPEKIIVAPYGYEEHLKEPPLKGPVGGKFVMALIASFDPRKGSLDLPKIFERLMIVEKNIEFRLLGCKGRFSSEEDILNQFSKPVQKHLKVVMTFGPNELESLIEDVNVGIFPSYLESFGFGILELMKNKIPVVSYNVPGPSDLLPDSLLVQRGDWEGLSDKVLKLFRNGDFFSRSSETCFLHAKSFSWESSCYNAVEFYKNSFEKL
ncbi:MAG: glycosyltransferase family 4 protein [Bacteriovoracaceae bacterium]|nr:glycosyltransferase family 4 protein [Bacteriovoracaceae bacterium]